MDGRIAILSLAIASAVGRVLYRLLFHPLSNYPGPKLAAVSNLPYLSWTVSGNLHSRLRELHDQYGDVIRIRPNALTYRAPQAWTDIYGHRKQGALPFSKDPQFFTPAPSGSSHMINANEADHARQKRLLTHAFSDRSLREQEPLVLSYINLFVSKLQESAAREEVVNMEELLNFLTFDIIGDLAFGEPFGCLQGSEYHPWVATIFKSVKTGAFIRAFQIYPILALAMRKMMPKSMIRRRVEHAQMSKEKVARRLQMTTTRPDFISYILKYNDERGMQRREIETNASIMITAGSETTATVLAACVFFLLKHADCHLKLTQEVRGTFPTEDSITFLAASKLPFLNAVIEESLRLHPPFPAIGPRLVPRGGAMINGQYVPGEVSVSVAHYSTFRASSNFAKPDSFIPDRWLEENKVGGIFESDKREALQPFSYGPRACIGRNLAYAEMRTTLAKIIYHFDLTLQSQCAGWDNGKSYIVWEKSPLLVRLKPANKG